MHYNLLFSCPNTNDYSLVIWNKYAQQDPHFHNSKMCLEWFSQVLCSSAEQSRRTKATWFPSSRTSSFRIRFVIVRLSKENHFHVAMFILTHTAAWTLLNNPAICSSDSEQTLEKNCFAGNICVAIGGKLAKGIAMTCSRKGTGSMLQICSIMSSSCVW